MRYNRTLFLLLVVALMFSSCSLYKVRKDVAPPMDIPDEYSLKAGKGTIPERWWEAFGDERLNALVSEALSANLDIAQAWARLDQSDAIAVKSASSRLPSVTFEGSTTRSRAYVSSDPVLTRQHSLGLAASYEIDLWGRVRSLDMASRLDSVAVRLDLETIAMSLSAQVVQTWFSLIEQTSQMGLTQTQVDASATQLDLVKLRFSRGLASALDIYQQRRQLAALKAQIPLIRAQINILVHQLNVLLGKSPGEPLENIPREFPEIWAMPTPGIPADLLTRRPDVEAARIRVEAADRRVAAAISERFPRITISASKGYGAKSFADLFDRMIWNITGGMVATIYDGGSKSAEVERTKAVVEERVYAYGQVVLAALAEVEDSLEREVRQVEYVNRLGEQLTLSEKTLDEAYNQYTNGLSDYLTVLNSLNSLQQTQRELLTARATFISYRIALCRSLGGTWTGEIKRENQTGEKS